MNNFQPKNISILSRNNCTGCLACIATCPNLAIEKQIDSEGFFFPSIINSKCINCGLCIKTCPILTKQPQCDSQQTFVAYARKKEYLQNSSSGGLFSVFAEKILNEGGIVVGAELRSDGQVFHSIIDSIDQLYSLQGSKYVQSYVDKNIYTSVKKTLDNQRKVLFSGTPCQIAAIKNFLKNNQQYLYTIEIVCHGVPSPAFFSNYHKHLKKKFKNFIRFNFRDYSNWLVLPNVDYKKKGTVENKKIKGDDSFYQDAFLKGLMHRESCYNCKYSSVKRIADITLGDFWGLDEKQLTIPQSKEGYSLLIISSEKGRILFNSIKKQIYLEPRDIQETIKGGNLQLMSPSFRPKQRNFFYSYAQSHSYKQIASKFHLNLIYKEQPILFWAKRIVSLFFSKMKRQKTKKISITTIFDNPNFGTYLQAFALSHVLKNKGLRVEVLFYLRPSWHNIPLIRRHTKFLEFFRTLAAYLKKDLASIQRIECRKFVKKNAQITKPYYSFEDIQKNPPKADLYVVGSDQVWNSIHNRGLDRTFFLDFVPSGYKKIAYAASIGMDSIPGQYKKEYKKLLTKFEAISVREKSNIDLLKDLNLSCEEVLDPTLLLTPKEWNEYISKSNEIEPYLLVYSVETKEINNYIGEIAKYIAKKLNLRIIEVSYAGKEDAIPNCDSHYFYSTPQEFLQLVYNANFILGSSYHLAAFSINFNKDFISISPDRFSSRINNLLEKTNLLKRKIDLNNDYTTIDELISNKIDYSYANIILNQERIKSIKYITDHILS